MVVRRCAESHRPAKPHPAAKPKFSVNPVKGSLNGRLAERECPDPASRMPLSGHKGVRNAASVNPRPFRRHFSDRRCHNATLSFGDFRWCFSAGNGPIGGQRAAKTHWKRTSGKSGTELASSGRPGARPARPQPDSHARGGLIQTLQRGTRLGLTSSHLQKRLAPGNDRPTGRVAEWFKAAVLKTAVGASPPWVRIPPLPPLMLASRSLL